MRGQGLKSNRRLKPTLAETLQRRLPRLAKTLQRQLPFAGGRVALGVLGLRFIFVILKVGCCAGSNVWACARNLH
jgi:hypothetical protein